MMTPAALPFDIQVQGAILRLVAEMVQGWDMSPQGEIAGSMRLVNDLGFCSVDIISLVVAIEEHFGTRNLGFADLLMRDGSYVEDLAIADLAQFVAAKLAGKSQ
jgi:acyl carrier protein